MFVYISRLSVCAPQFDGTRLAFGGKSTEPQNFLRTYKSLSSSQSSFFLFFLYIYINLCTCTLNSLHVRAGFSNTHTHTPMHAYTQRVADYGQCTQKNNNKMKLNNNFRWRFRNCEISRAMHVEICQWEFGSVTTIAWAIHLLPPSLLPPVRHTHGTVLFLYWHFSVLYPALGKYTWHTIHTIYSLYLIWMQKFTMTKTFRSACDCPNK